MGVSPSGVRILSSPLKKNIFHYYLHSDISVCNTEETIRPISSDGKSSRLVSGRSSVRIRHWALIFDKFTHSEVAQLAEHPAVNRRVGGSNPFLGAYMYIEGPKLNLVEHLYGIEKVTGSSPVRSTI